MAIDFGVFRTSHLNQGSEGCWAAGPKLAMREAQLSALGESRELECLSESHRKQRLLPVAALWGSELGCSKATGSLWWPLPVKTAPWGETQSTQPRPVRDAGLCLWETVSVVVLGRFCYPCDSLDRLAVHLTGSGRNMANTRRLAKSRSDQRAAQARSAGSLRRAFGPSSPGLLSPAQGPGPPEESGGGRSCVWADPWARTSPTPGPPFPRRAPPFVRAGCRREGQQPAGGAWAQPSLLALPTCDTDAPGRGARRPRGLPKAEGRGLGLASESPGLRAPQALTSLHPTAQRPWGMPTTSLRCLQVPRGRKGLRLIPWSLECPVR